SRGRERESTRGAGALPDARPPKRPGRASGKRPGRNAVGGGPGSPRHLIEPDRRAQLVLAVGPQLGRRGELAGPDQLVVGSAAAEASAARAAWSRAARTASISSSLRASFSLMSRSWSIIVAPSVGWMEGRPWPRWRVQAG